MSHKKVYHVDLTEQERSDMLSLSQKHTAKSESVKRSKILLAADRNGDKKWTDAQISEAYKVHVRTIERLRIRFIDGGVSLALSGHPRNNVDKIKFDATVETHLIATRCSEPPTGSSGWTLQLLADHLVQSNHVEKISRSSVHLLLKKTKLSLGLSENG